MEKGFFRLQLAVFALVSASFTNIYITQPILPVLQDEFGVNPVQVSMTVSIVILGIVFSNQFFGYLVDRISIKPIIFAGGICVATGGIICAITHDFRILIFARLFQGIFIPALTTSLAAWLARTLPMNRLGVVMGSYISATVLGIPLVRFSQPSSVIRIVSSTRTPRFSPGETQSGSFAITMPGLSTLTRPPTS